MNTFESGIRKPVISQTTPIFKHNIETINHVKCISYGNKENGYYIYTFGELYHVLNYYNQPVHPEDPQKTFKELDVKQIMSLCQSKTKYEIKIRKKLTYIISIQHKIPPSIYKLREIDKNILNDSFIHFTDAAMYMRGWNGVDEYPIENTLVNDQNSVNVRVNKSMNIFNEFIQKNEIDTFIYNLPLIEYKNDHFYQNNIKSKGLTIGNRISILKDINNINSCIRTSSNWFLASIYKYSILLDLKPKFDIIKVRKIG